MSFTNIRPYDWNRMLIGCISCFSRSHWSSHHVKLSLWGSLAVLVIDSSSSLWDAWSRIGQIEHGLHIWYVHSIHSFSYRQLPHLDFDSLLVFQIIDFLQPNCFILFSLLFVDLFLESNFHGVLLLLSLILHYAFLVSALGENIAMPLQLNVNSVFIYACSGLNIREVLFGDTGIISPVVMRITALSCVLRNIKSFIIEFVGIVLVICCITW